MPRLACTVAACVVLASTSARAADREPGPPPPDRSMLELDLESYRTSQTAGLWLFGGGLFVELAGVVLTQIDPWGPIGISGFATLGTGIAVVTAGMITLAVSRWRWQWAVRGIASKWGSGVAPGGGGEPD
jgi:hypothetical protein